ncbi:amino acid adenylation domain-containing protein [Filimonas zeae]|uniref:Carrier domain-containing protein n=1 Tax=Filimonas zeae TaxID=1737353 RepID=A0A917IQQ8_9BACT|nr:non-ribosomal peptide synthetase [Filimonas zeae]MDR6337941.1 amino acid adenylation domain-containing protein [Filimonas zeae]GGH60966.1 hypothetical protein GCM10011379_09420 [Filimonas zeae]
MSGSLTFRSIDYDPFRGPAVEKAGFTNESQKEIFLSSLIGGEDANRAYNEAFSVTFTGGLHADVLENAIQKLLQRHEALRAAVSANGEYVFVYAYTPFTLSRIHLGHLTSGAQQQYIREAAVKCTQQTFDLQTGPLVQFQLFVLSEEVHVLLMQIHHIIGDGWSVGVLLQDLGKLYSAAVRGEAAQLPEAPQMTAYAKAEREMPLAEQQRIRNYWLRQFAPAPPRMDMPVDFARMPRRSYTGRRMDYMLPVALTAGVQDMSRKAGSSFVTALLVAFEVFLYKLTGQAEIVLGLPSAGQASTGNNGLVGHCVNLLPLKSIPEADMPFQTWLRKRRQDILDAYEHQHITFGSLLKALNISRDSSRVPLVPVVFNVDMGLDNDVAFEGLQYELKSHPRQYETFELFVNISGRGQQLTVEWSYNTQLFRPETIEQFHQGFTHILTQIVQEPSVTLKTLALADAGGEQAVAAFMNNTEHEYPAHVRTDVLLSARAAEQPHAIALRMGQVQMSYETLFTSANQLARALQVHGVLPGDKVGVALDRTPELLIVLLGIMKAGAVFLPLDPSYPEARTQYVLEDTGAQLVITTNTYAGKFADVKCLLLPDLMHALANYATTAPEVVYCGNESAYILHTSGSTGAPKGVMVSHRNLVNLLTAMLRVPGITAADKVLAITSISFDISYVELLLPLLAGAQIVLADAATARDARLLTALIAEEAVTLMQATPATWRMLVDSGWQYKGNMRVISGGEALPLSLAAQLLNRCGEVWNMYGPTETTIYATAKQVTAKDKVITIGAPLQNMQLYVLDEQRQPVPVGSVGELYIGGDGVAQGYLHKTALTAERFVADAHGKGRLYKTGDLGKLLPQGEIQCLGRADHQIKIRGFRIEPEEIEFHLQTVPGVQQAVVHGADDGAGGRRLIAYIATPEKNAAAQGEMVAACRGALGQLLPAWMVPQQFVFVASIPVSANGKTDRQQLEQLHTPAVAVTQKEWQAPATRAQKMIAAIWQDLLELERPGLHDDFFEQGGHSLTAVSVMVRIEKETGKRLPISALFDHPTLAQLAALIEDKEEVSWTSLVPIKPGGNKTPVYMIHGSGLNVFLFHSLIKHFDEERPLYGIQALGLDGTDQAIHSVEEIAARYISDMLVSNPDGPYILIGYSLGGMIALEMAKQLQAAGKQVTLLGMIDTYVDNVARFDTTGMKLIKKVKRQFPKFLFILRSFFRYPKDTVLYQLRQLNNRALSLAGKEEVAISTEQSFQQRVYRQYEDAYLNYRLAPYHQPIHLFKVKKRLYYLDEPHYMGWKPFAKGGLHIHMLPGDHKTFIQPPYEVGFVRSLLKAIETAEANGAR